MFKSILNIYTTKPSTEEITVKTALTSQFPFTNTDLIINDKSDYNKYYKIFTNFDHKKITQKNTIITYLYIMNNFIKTCNEKNLFEQNAERKELLKIYKRVQDYTKNKFNTNILKNDLDNFKEFCFE